MDNQNIDDVSEFTTKPLKDVPERIIIKAVGVGGGGNNAVNHMYRQGIKNVSFVNINSDSQALRHSDVPNVLQIGDGLGAGNKPEKAKAFAEEATEDISHLFDDDTRMVFVTAGMGGGTGTGAAPVVARVAKERGLLTVGIVTIPFLFEGQVKIKKALAGADEMAKYVDALLLINNERLTEIYGDLFFDDAFGKADDTLSIAASSISELITGHGKINLDFNDVDTTLRNGGAAIISTGYGEGEGRVTAAIQDALNSPLLKNRDIMGSKKLLFCLFYNPKAEDKFLMSESRQLTQFIGQINSEVDVIWGVGHDESLGNQVKITILAAGFDITLRDEEDTADNTAGNNGGNNGTTFGNPSHNSGNQGGGNGRQFNFGGSPQGASGNSHGSTLKFQMPSPKPQPVSEPAPQTSKVEKPEEKISLERIGEEYGLTKIQGFTQERNTSIILGLNQLDDDAICDVLEKSPTYKRDRRIIDDIRKGAYDTANQNRPMSAGSGQIWSY